MSAARAGLAIAALASALACHFSVVRAGDDRFLTAELAWRPGVTLARDVARTLGPPDQVRASGDAMTFVYRFERRADAWLAVSFYLKLFQRLHERDEHSTLLVTFDAEDRLLYWGRSDLQDDDLAQDLGLE